MLEYFQVLSFYRKLKYRYKDELLQQAKIKFNLSGNRFEVLRKLDEYLRTMQTRQVVA